MRMRQAFVFLVVFFMACAAGADTVYVQAQRAKVMRAPAFAAEVLSVAQQGDAFALLGNQGAWAKIQLPQGEGWLPKLLLGSNPPIGEVRVLAKGTDSVQQEARRRASATTAVAAARGLRRDDRTRLGQETAEDHHALAHMEQFAVTPDDTLRFLQEGGR